MTTFYSDANNARVKVINGGIAAPLNIAKPTVGFTYSFAGQGGGTAGAANGVGPSGITLSAGTGSQSVGGDASGNIFFADYVLSYFYETFAQTGITAIIGGNNVSATAPAAGNYCNAGTTGPQMTDALYNGCPLTQTKIPSPARHGPHQPTQHGDRGARVFICCRLRQNGLPLLPAPRRFLQLSTSPASTTLTITSSGNLPLTGVSFTQSDKTNFSVVPATTNGCSGALPAGKSCFLTASFRPITGGNLVDSLALFSNATNVLRWGPEAWMGGDNSLTQPLSSFDAIDAILLHLGDRQIFPNLKK